MVRKHHEGEGPDGEKTTVQLIRDGDIDLVINTPYSTGGSARLDGYEIRTAAVRANIPCITTVQGLGAAVQGIEALTAGDIGVRSLQDWKPGSDALADGPALPPALRPRADPDRPGARAPRGVRGDPGRGARDPTRLPRRSAATGRRRWDCGSRTPLGLAAGFDKNAVGIDALGGPRLRPRRDRHGDRRAAARQPATAAVPAARRPRGDQPDGLQQRRRRGGRGPAEGPPGAAPSGGARSSASTSARPRSCRRSDAIADYEKSTRLLAPYADYLVVNVSSPNTPGLRDLQAVEKLEPLLTAVRRRRPTRSHRRPGAAAGQDRARPQRRGRARRGRPRRGPRPRRDHRHQHHDQPRRACAPTPRPSRRSAPAGSPVARCAARANDVMRALRGARRRRPDPDRRRRHHHADDARERLDGRCRRCCRATPRSSTRARCGRARSWARVADEPPGRLAARSTSPARCWRRRRPVPTGT